MATQYRYGTDITALWDALTPTTALNNGSAGDTTTGVSSGDSASVGVSVMCQVIATSAPLLVEIQHDTRQRVTGWRLTGSVAATLSNNQTVCAVDTENPPPTLGGSVSYLLQYWSGSAWVEVDGYGDDLPAVGFAETQTLAINSGVRTIEPTDACMWRLVAACNYAVGVAVNTLTLAHALTDFRLIGTDLGTACSYPPDGNDGEGGEENGGGSGGNGGGDSDGCGCASWTPEPRVTTTWTPKRCA